MLNSKYLYTCLILLIGSVNLGFAQLGFSHEIGAIVGPVQFRSDYGIRNNEETNFGNSGIGIGIIHYISFAYRADCNCYSTDTYFNDHFKLRSEISWNKTKLDHFGRWVAPDRTSANADKLRAHSGEAQNFDIGMQLEYFPLSIRSFQAFSYRFAPFVSLGAHYTASSPKSETTYGSGNVMDESAIYSYWYEDETFLPTLAPGESREYPINTDPSSAWSVVASVGVRYKLTKLSDLMLDLRWQYYFSDWIDGFNHQLDYNKFNDWLIWLNFGYVYYLD
ncbi:glutamate dehydrogenase [Mangrovimonas yunxiaonensis]|uniref:Glutamate dehydrogenase n=1 Tax=Mangrovimonas yunxiaonensis TaxID=1197477 RepID=A0A084TL11_9FLAO|nr:hypothetical protein [Mangrovimonas yunxiaonensis]KFB01397.1 glutamate dehydrogenase [Mangrovimonas yunxiaonensis]MBR9757581.1 glutamate dehydrogenase [Algicola sp.]GGH36881.1 glutamate dehydrogenase [Mangrovimonas yunxiaonensis]